MRLSFFLASSPAKASPALTKQVGPFPETSDLPLRCALTSACRAGLITAVAQSTKAVGTMNDNLKAAQARAEAKFKKQQKAAQA